MVGPHAAPMQPCLSTQAPPSAACPSGCSSHTPSLPAAGEPNTLLASLTPGEPNTVIRATGWGQGNKATPPRPTLHPRARRRHHRLPAAGAAAPGRRHGAAGGAAIGQCGDQGGAGVPAGAARERGARGGGQQGGRVCVCALPWPPRCVTAAPPAAPWRRQR